MEYRDWNECVVVAMIKLNRNFYHWDIKFNVRILNRIMIGVSSEKTKEKKHYKNLFTGSIQTHSS